MTKITEKKAKAAAEKYTEARKLFEITNAEKKDKMTQVNKEYDETLKKYGETMDEQQLIIETYVNQNREVLLDGAQSTSWMGLKIGYRKKPASLKLLEGLTWEKVIEKTRKLLPDFVKTKYELKKKEIAKLDEKKLNKLGVCVSQEEIFSIK